MDRLAQRFSTTGALTELRKTQKMAEDGEFSDAMWASDAGFGSLAKGIPTFTVPDVPDIQHGTTTLAFRYKGGVIVAVDSRATAGSYVASGTVKKVIEINPYLLGTMADTAADCQYWETYLGMHCHLHELRNRERISVSAASKYLSNLVYSYKGILLAQGTMICGGNKTGPTIYYVDSDGSRLKGDLFSVGSGSTFAYGVLDQGYHWDLTDEEAHELGRRSIYAAGHRDAFTGNSCNLYHIKEDGWHFVGNYDIAKLHDEGSGNAGYGYEIRVEGRSSANSP
ncbi:proteasome component pts1 [Mycena floridula]|nr:proteasome component pts1 [Mycena floridula]